MNIILAVITAIPLLLTGCAGSTYLNGCHGAEILKQEPGEMELRYCRMALRHPFGPHGIESFREPIVYGVALIGNGPVYIDPPFVGDFPFRCVGSVILDCEHNRVTMNMRRIVSKPGTPERTKPQPANGIYPIVSVRQATVPEQQLFKMLLTNNEKYQIALPNGLCAYRTICLFSGGLFREKHGPRGKKGPLFVK